MGPWARGPVAREPWARGPVGPWAVSPGPVGPWARDTGPWARETGPRARRAEKRPFCLGEMSYFQWLMLKQDPGGSSCFQSLLLKQDICPGWGHPQETAGFQEDISLGPGGAVQKTCLVSRGLC